MHTEVWAYTFHLCLFCTFCGNMRVLEWNWNCRLDYLILVQRGYLYKAFSMSSDFSQAKYLSTNGVHKSTAWSQLIDLMPDVTANHCHYLATIFMAESSLLMSFAVNLWSTLEQLITVINLTTLEIAAKDFITPMNELDWFLITPNNCVNETVKHVEFRYNFSLIW